MTIDAAADRLTRYLRAHGTTLDDVCERVREHLSLLPNEPCFAAGSVVDGLANSSSDLDVYVITDRDLSNLYRGAGIGLRVGTAGIDIETWHPQVVRDAATTVRLEAAAPVSTACLCINPRTLVFLHRLAGGVPLHAADGVEAARAQPNPADLARVLGRRAIAQIDSFHRDVAGMLAARQLTTAMCMTTELVGAVVDLILATLGNTNPAPKWRWELLERYARPGWDAALPGGPLNGTAASVFARLMLHADYPIDQAEPYCFDAVRMANRIVPWAERPPGDPSPFQTNPERAGSDAPGRTPLPRLRADARIRRADDMFAVEHVIEHVQMIVDPFMYEALLMCDGRTTDVSAARRLACLSGKPFDAARDFVDDVRTFVLSFGWTAPDRRGESDPGASASGAPSTKDTARVSAW